MREKLSIKLILLAHDLINFDRCYFIENDAFVYMVVVAKLLIVNIHLHNRYVLDAQQRSLTSRKMLTGKDTQLSVMSR